jgi:hypothetical protein
MPSKGGVEAMSSIKDVDILLVILYDESGFDAEKRYLTEHVLRKLKPDHWEFLSPQTYCIAMKNPDSAAPRFEAFLNEVRSLTAADSRFGGLAVSRREGPCPCEVNVWGRLLSVPINEMAWQTMREAVGQAGGMTADRR